MLDVICAYVITVGDVINKKIYNTETVNASMCIRDRLSLIYF